MTFEEIDTDVQGRIGDATSRRLDELVRHVFRIVDTYYDEREAKEIAALFEEYAHAHFDEILELRREVMRQWFTNHDEHCGPWPHEGDCQWPIPPVILAASPNEVYLLLLEVSGESF